LLRERSAASDLASLRDSMRYIRDRNVGLSDEAWRLLKEYIRSGQPDL
jgi:hypothetical protein